MLDVMSSMLILQLMHILVAFDKFKDSMTAVEACDAAAAGASRFYGPGVQITQSPLTDGGEGFCTILTATAGGFIEHHKVSGPRGEEIEAPLGWVEAAKLPKGLKNLSLPDRGRLAVIEMAAVAGLEQVPQDARHPKHCTTRGVGELIRIASASDADAILLGIGGSATSDLGLGALEALGLQFQTSRHKTIQGIMPQDWSKVANIIGEIEIQIPPIFIACDVNNPLLGSRGAAAVYGPQKGLLPEELEAFDTEAKRLAELLTAYFDQGPEQMEVPGSGAAGGIGFGLKVACGAEFVPGFELVSHWLDIGTKVSKADLVLSGEGKLDASSLNGKGPLALAAAAHAANKRCLLFAGRVDTPVPAYLTEHFDRCDAFGITPEGMPLEQALKEGAQNLSIKVQSTVKRLHSRDDR